MDIALASDNNYVQHMAVTIASIILNNMDVDIRFHIMDNGIDERNIKRIIKLIELNKKEVYFYDFSKLEDEAGFQSHSDVLPISTYSRIFLPPRLQVQAKRLIYMDVDMVCCESLTEIYNMDMEGKIIAAVQDFADIHARSSNSLDIEYRYVNMGFMLIDVEKWLRQDITDKVHKYILDRNGKVVQEDQGALNSVLRDEIKLIHPKYNAMTPFFFVKSKEIRERYQIPVYYTDAEIREAKNNPVIIHYLKYNGFVNRPWEENCSHPLREKYHYYLNKTEWAGAELLPDKRSRLQVLKCNYHLRVPWCIKKLFMKLRS